MTETHESKSQMTLTDKVSCVALAAARCGGDSPATDGMTSSLLRSRILSSTVPSARCGEGGADNQGHRICV